jgi:geranylgeranyl diphosphate synthase type II
MRQVPVTMDHTDAMRSAARRVDARLDQLLHGGPSRLEEAMRYAVLGGGKRLRPVLCLWTAELLAGAERNDALALDVACSLELLHTYSLVHDDLPCMDDDALRRGRPTVHVQFGEALAVLVGDALQSLAFETVLRAAWDDAGRARDAALDLAVAAGARHLVGGQVLDLQAEGSAPDAQTVLDIHMGKTAALLRCSMLLGARVAAASSEQIERVARIGTDLGLAFQIIDDLLDETAASETLGKTAGKDREAGKATWPAVHGLEKSRQDAARKIDNAVQGLRSWPRHDKLVWLSQYLQQRVF